MREELGAAYSAPVENAFTDLFNWVNGVLANADQDSVPTAFDKQIMRDNMNVLKAQKNNVGAKILLRLIFYLKSCPSSSSLTYKPIVSSIESIQIAQGASR